MLHSNWNDLLGMYIHRVIYENGIAKLQGCAEGVLCHFENRYKCYGSKHLVRVINILKL